MFEWLRRSSGWHPPKTAGEETTVCRLAPAERPVAKSAQWVGDELHVEAAAAGSVSLFDVSLPDVDACRLTYRASLQTGANPGPVYLEMYCRIPDRGLFFSRAVDQKIPGKQNWTPVETPFYLEAGQHADLLHLNLVFEAPGTAVLRDLQVTSAALAANESA